MPIDPNIPLNVQPLKVESPVNQLAMMGETMKLGELGRNIEEQNKLNEYLRSGVDLSSAEGRRGLINYGKTGLAYGKALNEQDAAAANLKKTNAEVNLKDMEIAREGYKNLLFNPSDNNFKAHLEDAVLAGKMTPAQAQQEYTTVAGLNQAQRLDYVKSRALKAEEYFKQQEQSRHNRTTEGISAGQLDVARYNATKPVFSESAGGFVVPPTAKNPTATIIPLSNPEATTKGQIVAKGKNLVNDVATDMATSYGVLKDLGGIKSKENSPQKNISAALQSSMVGQLGGSMMGTPEQDARDAIMSQRPILVQAIVKATGMTASQINSDKELKNLLDAATDPSKGYETNIKTLNKINQRFGLGGDIVELPSTPTKEKVSVGATPKANPTIDALLEKYK